MAITLQLWKSSFWKHRQDLNAVDRVQYPSDRCCLCVCAHARWGGLILWRLSHTAYPGEIIKQEHQSVTSWQSAGARWRTLSLSMGRWKPFDRPETMTGIFGFCLVFFYSKPQVKIFKMTNLVKISLEVLTSPQPARNNKQNSQASQCAIAFANSSCIFLYH